MDGLMEKSGWIGRKREEIRGWGMGVMVLFGEGSKLCLVFKMVYGYAPPLSLS